MSDDRQTLLDRFYWKNGPCCAGCDWWRSVNANSGECLKSKIVPGKERMSMLGISRISATIPAGHAITGRDHSCGLFEDKFDWTTLPPHYLRSIGYATR